MPNLRLRLLDAKDEPLGQAADVMIRRQSTGELTVVQSKPDRMLSINLTSDVYLVQVDPASYLAAGAFAMVSPSGGDLTMSFPIDPQKVKRVDFPSYVKLGADARRILTASKEVLGFPDVSGKALYDEVDDIRKAGMLNILAKAARSPLTNGRTVISYFQQVLELRGDRFFVAVPRELREETKNSVAAGLYQPVPEILHHPPAGFDHAGSFKSPDHYGNIQLTFFSNGTDWRGDIDIDLAEGLEHVFEVLRDEVTNRPTHPYDVHEILVKYQKLDPGYDFEV
jgi:hypothetical protein